jgi:broad specificity phosphatase PhoE
MSASHNFPRLFLIRHGDTDWTDAHRHTGRTDIPLNSKGEAAARQLANRLKRETFTQIFTSPLARARRTCELAGLAARAQLAPDLVEWDYGDYEGLTTAEIHRINPNWDLFRDGAPNGESPDQAAARAARFLETLKPINGDIAAFAHGHIIRMIAARWLNFPPQSAKHFYTATASLSILGYEHDPTDPVILLWNEVERDA